MVVQVLALLLFTIAASSAAQVTPATVTDSQGRSADINSTITWGPLPSGDPYLGQSIVVESQDGMNLMYRGMRGFVNGVFSQEIPWAIITGLLSGTTAIGAVYADLIRFGAGLMACLVIGFLFIVIFPIVGCCCCCSRVCGCCKCCGGGDQDPNPSRCGALTLIITVAIVDVLFVAGLICSYYTNESMSQTLPKILPTIQDNVVDLNTYANNTIREINYVAIDGFNFTSTVIGRDLDNIGPIIAAPVQASFGAAGLSTAFDTLLTLDPLVANLSGTLTSVSVAANNTETSVNALSVRLTAVQTGLDATLTKCSTFCSAAAIDTSGLSTNFNTSSLPDFSSQQNGLDSVNSRNLTAIVLEGQSEFNNIDQNITENAATAVSEIKAMLQTFQGTVNSSVSPIADLFKVFDNLTQGLEVIEDPLGTAGEYERYRWIAGLCLCSILLLILLLHAIGALTITCSGALLPDDTGAPKERTCGATFGKNTMLASFWLAFACGALLMLLVTLTFLIGAPLDKLFCQNMEYPEFTLFKHLLDGGPGEHTTLLGTKEGYPLGEMLFQNSSINITASGLLTDCHDGRPAWEAVYIDQFINLTQVTDYSQDIDIDSQINSINVDMSTIVIVKDDLKTEVADLKTNLQGIDYNGLRTELQKTTANTDLTAFANNLTTLAQALEDQLTAGTVAGGNITAVTESAAELRVHAANLTDIQSNELTAVSTAQADMLTAVNNLNASSVTVPDQMDAIIAQLQSTESTLQTTGEGVIKNESKVFAQRLLGVADQFAAYAVGAVQGSVGVCTPIWTLYTTIINNLMCDNIVQVLNAFWFTLGWCVFSFTVGVVLTSKMATRVKGNTYGGNKIRPTDYNLEGHHHGKSADNG